MHGPSGLTDREFKLAGTYLKEVKKGADLDSGYFQDVIQFCMVAFTLVTKVPTAALLKAAAPTDLTAQLFVGVSLESH